MRRIVSIIVAAVFLSVASVPIQAQKGKDTDRVVFFVTAVDNSFIEGALLTIVDEDGQLHQAVLDTPNNRVVFRVPQSTETVDVYVNGAGYCYFEDNRVLNKHGNAWNWVGEVPPCG